MKKIICFVLAIYFSIASSASVIALYENQQEEKTALVDNEKKYKTDYKIGKDLEFDELTGQYSEKSKLIIDNNLRERGFPEDELKKMSYDSKKNFYDCPNFEYIGNFEIQVPEENNFKGQIQNNELTIRFDLGASYYWYNGSQVLDKIKVTYTYGWKKYPVFRFEDPIGVSWDSTKFEMIPDTFCKVDKYSVYDSTTGKTHYFTQSEEYGFAKASPAGVTWYADLVRHTLVPTLSLDSLWGYGSFDIGTQYIMYKDQVRSTIYGHYVHNKLSIGLSLSIPYVGSFSVSGGGLYDERGNSTNIWC